VPALIVVFRRAMVEDGGLSNVLERLVHRLPGPPLPTPKVVDEGRYGA
jgi:hypothetical protein